MNIFEIIKNLYTLESNSWIDSMESTEIQPIIVNKFLLMNDELIEQASYLSEYEFTLQPKHWLCLANQLIPKKEYRFYKYLKPVEDDETFNVIFDKLNSHLKLSDNDWKNYKKYFVREFKSNQTYWFKILGIEKKEWKKFNLDFNNIKVSDKSVVKNSLSMFMG